jgi:membrane protease YdiL (CAAX protease family)
MRGPEGTLTLLVMALVWFILAAVLATAATAAIMFALHPSARFNFDETAFVLLLAPMTQLFLVLGCLRRGKRVGEGSLREGLAWLPIRRRLDVALLTGFAAVLAIGHVALVVSVPAYRNFFEHSKTSIPMPDQSGLATAAYAAWVLGVVVIGAAVSEELFFRGWLWVGLSRWWGVSVTAPVTGCLWLMAHISDGGWRRVLALVPAMVLISLARALGGSVRASMAVHMANNAILSAVLIAGRFASQ